MGKEIITRKYFTLQDSTMWDRENKFLQKVKRFTETRDLEKGLVQVHNISMAEMSF